MMNTGNWWYLFLELFFNAIAPSHLFDHMEYVEINEDLAFETRYQMNDILLWFSFIRLYHIVRYYFYQTEFMNPRSHRVCDI